MTKPLVTFLVPDIGAPTVGAAVKLADLLHAAYDTEIVGPDFGSGVCGMYRDAYPFRSIPAGRLYRFPDYGWERRRLARELRGDVLVAVKAFAHTVPVALAEGRRRRVPVAVYLDEWDAAVWYQKSFTARLSLALRHAHHPLNEAYHGLVERTIRRTDDVWSTTTFLQRRFGGAVIHAGVKCDYFKPQPVERVEALKKTLGLSSRRVIVFGGVVRPHKGVEEILEALARLKDSRNALLVVGPITEHLAQLLKDPRYQPYLVVAGDALGGATSLNAEIHRQMPLYLDVGDLVVLPLRDTLLAQSQMPIKVFEAMAMGKPLVVTRVADLPEMVKGCGWVVPPDDPGALADAIGSAFERPQECREFGARARERALAEFSGEVCSQALCRRVAGLLDAGDEA